MGLIYKLINRLSFTWFQDQISNIDEIRKICMEEMAEFCYFFYNLFFYRSRSFYFQFSDLNLHFKE